MTTTDSILTAPRSTTALIVGVEVWAGVDGEMVRHVATPSIGDLDQQIKAKGEHPVSTRIGKVIADRLPSLLELKAVQMVAVLWPVLDRDRVSSVIVLYLHAGPQTALATELWQGRPGRSELCLEQSSYTGLDRFAKLSPHIAFPKGSGLPGQAWQTNLPQIDADLTGSDTFMRSSGARSEGLEVGYAIPCIDGTSLQSVGLFMSGNQQPLAKTYETWVPGQRGGSLRLSCVDGAYIHSPALERASRSIDVPAGDTWIGRAWATRKPEVVCDSTGKALERRGASEDGITSGIAIPIIVLDDVAAVAVLMW
ncbi:MAG: GAF domain-containing protein [Planctomycetota bacterium]